MIDLTLPFLSISLVIFSCANDKFLKINDNFAKLCRY